MKRFFKGVAAFFQLWAEGYKESRLEAGAGGDADAALARYRASPEYQAILERERRARLKPEAKVVEEATEQLVQPRAAQDLIELAYARFGGPPALERLVAVMSREQLDLLKKNRLVKLPPGRVRGFLKAHRAIIYGVLASSAYSTFWSTPEIPVAVVGGFVWIYFFATDVFKLIASELEDTQERLRLLQLKVCRTNWKHFRASDPGLREQTALDVAREIHNDDGETTSTANESVWFAVDSVLNPGGRRGDYF